MTPNAAFLRHTDRIPALYVQFMAQGVVPIAGASFPKAPAIYAFYLGDAPVHVGRTRNLRQRLNGHVSSSHYSASFAFKRARAETGRVATYRKGDSRSALMTDPVFRGAFDRASAEIKGMSVRYLVVPDPIEQYLLELYAALELQTSMSEFDTH